MKKTLLFCVLLLTLSVSAYAADWSNTEIQYQFGKLNTPTFAGGGKSYTHVMTFQHASGWKYGDNFFFVDFYDSNAPAFNNRAVYAEVYSDLRFNRLRGHEKWTGPIGDIGLIMGINWSTEARDIKYLPGIVFTLNIPGFAFANLAPMALIDQSKGIAGGGAPSEDLTYLIDFSWGLPFSLGSADFSLEGHVELGGQTENELGNTVKWHVLGQPQLRYDLGKVFGREKTIFIGTEVQFWINKLGESRSEFAPQALFVWRL